MFYNTEIRIQASFEMCSRNGSGIEEEFKLVKLLNRDLR